MLHHFTCSLNGIILSKRAHVCMRRKITPSVILDILLSGKNDQITVVKKAWSLL